MLRTAASWLQGQDEIPSGSLEPKASTLPEHVGQTRQLSCRARHGNTQGGSVTGSRPLHGLQPRRAKGAREENADCLPDGRGTWEIP